MYVFLPKKSLDDFLPNLTTENWRQWTTQLRSRKGTVELPRFKLENEYNLKQSLTVMGMPLAFTRRANFHGISDEPLYIDWVKQKTYVDVNEEGTEAAAVTGMGFCADGGPAGAAAFPDGGGPAICPGHPRQSKRGDAVSWSHS